MKTKTHFLAAGMLLAALVNGFGQPAITKQPTNQSVSLGASAAFQVSATTANPPILYQWRFASTNLALATSFRLVLTNIQVANAGDYDVMVSDNSGSVTSLVVNLDVDPTFTKITVGSIVNDVGSGAACAWGDYDNDGFLDLLVTSAYNVLNNQPQKNLLFHNNRDGTFTKITNSVVASEARDWRGCSWVDYDNDGYLDVFVTSTDDSFPAQNELFRNNGDGTFTKMTAKTAGAIVPGGGGSEDCIWADYDNDGFVDLFIARYGIDWLYHNDGNGVFSSITNVVAGPVHDDSYAAAWGDYNNDGRPDLFVTVSSNPPDNRLYLNLGSGSFSRVTSGSIFTDHARSSRCSWADYDNDGYLDLFVNGETNSFLYHNNGDGTFTSMTNNSVGSILAGGSGAWGDYDNDGFLDMVGPPSLIHNNGDGSFTEILRGSIGNDGGINVLGAAWGDYDNDGFLDLFVARGAETTGESNLLYRNNGNSNGWVKIKLVGTVSNRSAIGAKVRVQATIRERTFWQMREINTGAGWGAGPLEAHFGLGDATNIDLVRIEWPSGIVQTMANVSPRQFLTVVEHQENAAATITITGTERSAKGVVKLSMNPEPGLLYVFEASTNLTAWTKLGVRTNVTGTVMFLDATATNFTQRFYRLSAP